MRHCGPHRERWPACAGASDRLRGCAHSLGRELGPIKEAHLTSRLAETDAELISRGLRSGLISIDGNYVVTRDPYQSTVWLVEGDPARPCWEYVPHIAAYVELIEDLSYPVESIRFETPGSEMNLDLAVVDEDGRIVVLGEVKRETRQVEQLAQLLLDHSIDPGKAATVRAGGPQGARREAWKLAHQLWTSRAPWLWLVASGRRVACRVTYDSGLELEVADALPGPGELGSQLSREWARITQ